MIHHIHRSHSSIVTQTTHPPTTLYTLTAYFVTSLRDSAPAMVPPCAWLLLLASLASPCAVTSGCCLHTPWR
eukprot:4006941-Amphidinium_carterae.1